MFHNAVIDQAREVKSCSRADSAACAFSQVQEAIATMLAVLTRTASVIAEVDSWEHSPEGRLPQAHVSPSTAWFSEVARSHVH